ncbi:MAG TPA: aminotransferase class V-fold PLP-dependent enzyme [Syntrophomonadaceae bacterium]|nr:aminotransferase class V-fold PLP-dependent enzyme [Syntrophomonadaceae bacterium]
MIAKTAVIDPKAKVNTDCTIGEYCVIEDGVVLEEGVVLGHHVVVHSGTVIGAGTVIGDGSVLGRSPLPAATSTVKAQQEIGPLVIGKNCTIGAGVVVYRGSRIDDSCFLGDNSSVRENCKLGEAVLVGQRVVVENGVEIGDYTKIQTGAYITAATKIEERVFIAPMVTTTNDNYMGRTEKRFASRRGPILKKGCRVGGGVTLLPGVTIGEEAFIAAGSIVTKDAPPYQLLMGTPARVKRPVPDDELLFQQNKEDDNSVVPSFNLKRQNATLQAELSAVLGNVIGSGQFILGENVKVLENEIAEVCGAQYGIGVANGSDALYLALLACGIEPGDEVITTPFTFFATAGSIVRAGAVPVFVDIDPKTYNIDTELIEEKITPRTKAILPVHLFGQAAEMGRIMEIAHKHGLKVIEDAAQALGCEYQGRPGGGIGDAGCLSFFPTKNLGCFGDGGMVVTNNQEIAERVRMLRVHGAKKKYYHELLGVNSRLDELQAAILRIKLPHFKGWLKKRQEYAELYNDLFKASGLTVSGYVKTPYHLPGCRHTYNQYTIAVRKRDELRDYLKQRGIGTTVYYPLPLHLQPVFRDLGYKKGDFPQAEQAADYVLSLPMFPELTEEEIRRVVKTITDFYGDEAQ